MNRELGANVSTMRALLPAAVSAGDRPTRTRTGRPCSVDSSRVEPPSPRPRFASARTGSSRSLTDAPTRQDVAELESGRLAPGRAAGRPPLDGLLAGGLLSCGLLEGGLLAGGLLGVGRLAGGLLAGGRLGGGLLAGGLLAGGLLAGGLLAGGLL